MTNNNSNINWKSISNYQTYLLLIALAFILVLIFKGSYLEKQNKALTKDYQEEVKGIEAQRQAEFEEKVRLSQIVFQNQIERDSIISAGKLQLEALKQKTAAEKRELVKRFQHDAVETPEGWVCFDSTGIDSILRFTIDCETKKAELVVADSTISTQKAIISSDSVLIDLGEQKFQLAENEAKKQFKEAKRLRTVNKVIKAVAITTTAIAVAVLIIK